MPDPLLQTYLADRDTPCPSCNYNLRGLTTTRCPECNQELELQIGLVEPRLGAFILGLVGICMGLGFCVLLAAWLVAMSFGRQFGSPPPEVWPPNFAGTVIGALFLFVWIRRRRALGRQSTALRYLLATLVTIVSLVCPVWFMATVS